MRCKPGDLAVIVDAPKGSTALGAIVKVLCAADREPIYASNGARHQASQKWLVRSERELTVRLGKRPYDAKEFIAPDSALRPIRPQADDAKDESAAWLPPVPHLEPA